MDEKKYFYSNALNLVYTGEMQEGDRIASDDEIRKQLYPCLPDVPSLWAAAEAYYSGADAPEASRLAKSETDAYQLGQENFQRRASGKSLIGTTVISPENPRLIANLEWGQAIWADYYTRKARLEAGDTGVDADFSNHGDKPFSFAEVIAAENAE